MIHCVSILCFNRLELTKRCLDSVREHSPADLQILVTDNGSTDGTGDYLRTVAAEDPRVEVLDHGRNSGIAEGKDLALARCRADWFISLDNDATVGAGWIEALQSGFTNPKIGLVGRSNTYGQVTSDGVGTSFDANAPLEYIDGSCFMIPTDLAREVGVSDPLFYGLFCCDDTDLSLRLRMRGYEIATVPAPIEHREKPITDHGTEENLNPKRVEAHRRLVDRWGYYLRTKRFDARMVIRRRAGIGDVVLMTPLPRLLKERWPQVRITIATEWAEPFDNNPYIEGIVHADRFPDGGDYAIDLDGRYELTPKQTIWASYAEALGVDPSPRVPELFLNDYHEIAVQNLLAPLAVGPIAVLSIEHTAWPGRNVPISLWPEVVADLKRRGLRTVAVGRTKTLDGIVDLDLGGQTGGHLGQRGLLTIAALMRRAALFVGIDSCPFHLAQAARTPSVVVFGCINPAYRILHPRVVPVVVPGLDCIGCHHEMEPPRYDWSGCRRNDLACMYELTAQHLLAGVEKAWRLWVPQPVAATPAPRRRKQHAS